MTRKTHPRLQARWLLAFAFAAVCLVWAGALIATWWSGGARSDVSGWLEAFATLAAFAAAVVAAIFVGQTFDVERRREDRWYETERRAQASLVAAWHGRAAASYEEPGPSSDAQEGITSVEILFRNASHVPVKDVSIRLEIEVWTPGSNGERFGIVRQPFGRLDLVQIPPAASTTAEPQKQWIAPRAPFPMRGQGFDPAAATVQFHVVMRFRDAAGVTWERDEIGRLQEIEEPFAATPGGSAIPSDEESAQ